jgi:hypothetical protein
METSKPKAMIKSFGDANTWSISPVSAICSPRRYLIHFDFFEHKQQLLYFIEVVIFNLCGHGISRPWRRAEVSLFACLGARSESEFWVRVWVLDSLTDIFPVCLDRWSCRLQGTQTSCRSRSLESILWTSMWRFFFLGIQYSFTLGDFFSCKGSKALVRVL